MKKWKTVFAVSGVTLALSAICGVAHLRESSHRGGISPQLAKASLVGQSETQRNVGSAGTMHDYHASGIVDRNTNPQLDKAAFAQKTKKLQIPFIANNGQVDKQVKYYANTFGGTVFVTKDGEIVYALPNNSSESGVESLESEGKRQEAEARIQGCRGELHSPNGISPLERGDFVVSAQSNDKGVCNTTPIPNNKNETHPRPLLLEGRTGVALREEFVGAMVKTIQGEDPSITKVNYFKGSDPSKWKTNVSTYDIVSLGDVYDGIELKLKAYGNNVEKLFCVKPGADPEQIKISLSGIQPHESPLEKGARGLWVNEKGQLVAETELGPVKFTKPIAYQEIDGKRVEVDVEYRLSNPKSEYGFKDVGWVERSETQQIP